MSKDRNETDLTQVGGNANSFLAGFVEQDTSMDGMEEYRILPRFKVIQPTSDQTLKKTFGEGTAIIRPGDAVIWKDTDPPFKFVPQFFWVEFCKWADLRDKENRMIMETTYDPLSDIAKKAKDYEARHEVYPGMESKPDKDQFKFRYVEHLRFCGIIYGDHEFAETQVVLSFERGEFNQGKNFISAIKMRKQKIVVDEVETSAPIPLWAQIWQFSVGFREPDANRKWYGFDFTSANPSVINAGDADKFFEIHKALKDLHEKNRLRVDDDDAGDAEVKDSKDF